MTDWLLLGDIHLKYKHDWLFVTKGDVRLIA